MTNDERAAAHHARRAPFATTTSNRVGSARKYASLWAMEHHQNLLLLPSVPSPRPVRERAGERLLSEEV